MRARIDSIRDRVDAVQENMVRFFREILAIPSTDGQIGEVGERIAEEMRSVGFDEVRFD
jgi:acetylornithine deacetylase/succinyl-diaminopimelate desuccinylase-like protein